MTFSAMSHPDKEDRAVPLMEHPPITRNSQPAEPPDLFDPTKPVTLSDLKTSATRLEWLFARREYQASIADWDRLKGQWAIKGEWEP